MKLIVKGIINENEHDRWNNYLTKVSQRLKKPYFYNLIETFDIPYTDDNWDKILSKIYNNENIVISYYRDTGAIYRGDDYQRLYYEDEDGWTEHIYDDKGNEIKRISNTGYWEEWGYDDNGNMTFYNNSDNHWTRITYNENGYETRIEDYTGFWKKMEYDEDGYMIYFETSQGNWMRKEVDSEGNVIYKEDNEGNITDNRWKYNNNINESTDKMMMYYDKISNILLRDTKYNIYDSEYVEILFPMYEEQTYVYEKKDMFEWMVKGIWLVGWGDVEYLKNHYGLDRTDEPSQNNEVEIVMSKYCQKLGTKIYNDMVLTK